MEGEELESLKTNIVEYLVKGTLLRDREKDRSDPDYDRSYGR